MMATAHRRPTSPPPSLSSSSLAPILAVYRRHRATASPSTSSSQRLHEQQRHHQQQRRRRLHRRARQQLWQAQAARCFSVYGFGEQWTGALSRGPSGLFDEEAPELSYEEIRRFGDRQNMVPLTYDADGGGRMKWKCVAASAGWGHTAIVVEDDDDGVDGGGGEGDGGPTTTTTTTTTTAAAAAAEAEADRRRKLLVCGRPHEFQTLLRLRRLPSSSRNFCVRHSSPSSSSSSS